MSERVVVGNTYVGNKEPRAVVNWLRNLRATVFLICELGGLYDDLDAAGQCFSAPNDRPRDVGIWISRRVRNLTAIYIKLTSFIPRPESNSPNLWRDRWLVRLQRGKRVWYVVHANAAIAGPEGRYVDNEGAKAWKDALDRFRSMVRNDQQRGCRVKIGGDFNCRPNAAVHLNPVDLFNQLGMEFINVDVMYLAWDPKCDELLTQRIMGKVPGADAHGSLFAEFKPKRRLLSSIIR